jgi:5'-3' exonuclease
VDEEERMLHCIQKKNEQAQRGVAKGMDASEGLPLEWKIERNMTNGKTMALNWRSQYWAFIHPQADKSVICSEYVYGVQWIIDYYTGKPVNLHWVFPSWIPPLWTDLAEWLAKKEFPKRAEMYNAPIKPEEQLTMVLPLESWNLIENKNLKMVPILAPQMWPKKFPFFSFGRRWLWECEARIPVLTAERLHEILNDLTIDGECAGKNS